MDYDISLLLALHVKIRDVALRKKIALDSVQRKYCPLVDFAIGLVNSVFNLSDGQVMFFEEFE